MRSDARRDELTQDVAADPQGRPSRPMSFPERIGSGAAVVQEAVVQEAGQRVRCHRSEGQVSHRTGLTSHTGQRAPRGQSARSHIAHCGVTCEQPTPAHGLVEK